MAEDQSVEALAETLQAKREELSQLRADVQAAKDKLVDDVQRAALRAEIAQVDQQIDLVRADLKLQEAQDPENIGAGIPPETPPEPPQITDAPPTSAVVENAETVVEQPNVDDEAKKVVDDGTDNTPKGDEN